MNKSSQIGIKKEALRNNIEFIRTLTNNLSIISAVIKGNAYGHGINIIIPALEDIGINHFSVYSSSEAYDALKVKSKKSTLMIMGFICPDDFDWIINNKIEFYVSDLHVLNKALKTSKLCKKKAIIHLDIETGMNRTGLNLIQLKQTIEVIKSNQKHFHLKGVTSHFAGAESIANHTRIMKQFSIFKRRVKLLNDYNIFPEQKHIASSAAAINYPETRLDLIRTGILIYGYWPTKETFLNYVHRKKNKTDPLKRVLFWDSQVAHIKKIAPGEFIGYGLNFQAPYSMKIMIVPVGYSNGFSRSLSNNGHVLVHGKRAAVIGSVNMNMTIVDITEIQNIKIGDQVTLIGRQQDIEISFSSFAEMNNLLNYEILARLPQNILRKIV